MRQVPSLRFSKHEIETEKDKILQIKDKKDQGKLNFIELIIKKDIKNTYFTVYQPEFK